MITASREIFYNVMMGEWKGLDIRVLQILNDGNVYSKTFTVEDFIFDEIDACNNCSPVANDCEECDGMVEIFALVGYIKINKRKVEEGAVVPLVGDVLFDLRENHIVVLSDNDITVISRAYDVPNNHSEEDRDISDLPLSDLKLNVKMYLMQESKIKRLAAKALYDGRTFKDLAGKKAIGVEITYTHQNKKPLFIRAIRLFNIYFDENGCVDEELTFPKQSDRQNDTKDKQLSGKVVELEFRDKEPILTKKQKEVLKNRLIKDFGEEVWKNTPVRVKSMLG